MSTKETIGTGMQVCQLWAKVGKPILWQELKTPNAVQGLLKTLARWDFTRDFTAPSVVNWRTFLEYTHLVHSLSLDPSNGIGPVLRFIAETRPVFDVFPNLENLKTIVGEPESIQHSSVLLHPALRRWTITCYRALARVKLLTQLLPISRLSGLVYLEIQTTNTRVGAKSLGVFQGLPLLASLVLPRYSATIQVLEILAHFPALCEIRTNNSGPVLDSIEMNHHPTISLHKGAFHMLTALTVSGCPCQISDLVDNIHFPSQIHSLAIESMQCNQPYVSPHYQRIVEKCRGITELALRDVIQEVVTLYSDLEIFYSYRLTRLRIDSYWAYLEGFPKDITELACRFSSIEILDFNPEPCKPEPYFLGDIDDRGHFVLNDLFILAKHCPKLRQLSIWVSTSEDYAVPHDAVPFTALQRIHLGRSLLTSSRVEGVAFFLAQLLPLSCQVTSSKMLTGYHRDNWVSVNRHLTNFRTLMKVAELRERARWCSKVTGYSH